MKTLKETMHIQALYDFYGVLLTEKQQAYFEGYYHKDYSITELSENNQVSRNAVFDQLKRVEQKLIEYESKLHLLEKRSARQSVAEHILQKDNDLTLDEGLKKLLEIE